MNNMIRHISIQIPGRQYVAYRNTKRRACHSLFVSCLIVSGLCLSLFIQTASGQATGQTPSLSMAPLNPEFIAWQKKKAETSLKTLDRKDQFHGYIPPTYDWSHLRSQKLSISFFDAVPSKFDLRESGHVTSVKNKGNCGCCWSFATYSSLESWLLKNRGERWDFSENHLKNHHGFDDEPCDGGDDLMSAAYLTRWSGPVSESDDPYYPGDDRSSPGGPCQKYVQTVLIFSTVDEIKNALMTYGGLWTSMCLDESLFNASSNTYYYSGSGDRNHAVTLVGWDDNKTVPGAPDKGAWIAKNDFGTNWGENGYFYISYYDSKAVKIMNVYFQEEVPYAVTFCDAVPASTYVTNYQYDPLGLISSVGYDDITTLWGANIYTAWADEYLGAVGFYALRKNTSYEIYIYDNFNGSEFSHPLGPKTSGTLTYPGYHTVTLSSPIPLTMGDDFSIVIKFTTPGYDRPVAIELPIEDNSSAATANLGQSYFSGDGEEFSDITSIDGFENANICIKGLTVPGPAFVDIGLRVFDGSEIISIACEPEENLTSPLRIAKNGKIYGIVLVDPSDPHASKMIIQTGSGPKAMRKF